MREIHIKPVLNGFIVTVGCGAVVFTSIDELCKELNRYHSAPEQVEKEYQEKAINKSRMPEMATPENERQPATAPAVETALGYGR